MLAFPTIGTALSSLRRRYALLSFILLSFMLLSSMVACGGDDSSSEWAASGGQGGQGGNANSGAAGGMGGAPGSPSKPWLPLGANLEAHSSYSSEIIFVDGFKRSRSWIPRNYPFDDSWDSGVSIPLDEQGYPLQIPYQPAGGGAPQVVTTMMYDELGGSYPAGTYTLLFEGSGTVAVSGAGVDQQLQNGGSYPIEVTPTQADSAIFLHILASDPADHIRNIRFVMPGHLETYQTQPFYPPFIARLSEMSVVRFTQTQQTNGGDYPCDNDATPWDANCVKTWQSRAKQDDQTQASVRGVALEYLIDIANQARTDAWLCLPHGADDDYIEQFARLVSERLDPGLRAYLELSNELWNFNGDYPQFDWAGANGAALGLDEDPNIARMKFVTMRSVQMFAIFEQELAPERMVKIMPGFIAIPWMNDQQLSYLADSSINPLGIQVDALAIGAYFGGAVANRALASGLAETISADEILQQAAVSITEQVPVFGEPGALDDSLLDLIAQNRAVADSFGVGLVAYEGGQHILETHGWDNNVVLGQRVIEANRHPGMYDVYNTLLDVWYGQSAGGLFVHYSLSRRPSIEWGCFGSLEHTEQPLEQAHKFRALVDYKQQLGR